MALPLARRIVARLAEVPGVTHASTCGSLRRFSETIGDVDILVSASDPGPVMDAVVALPAVDTVLGRGAAKTSIVTRRGTQVDVRVVAPAQLGAALLYFTGSKGHNIKLRQRALAREWTLNEYALSEIEGGKIVASETEEDIYRALGLAYIPPVLREDAGEIEAAETGTLPRPIGPAVRRFPPAHDGVGRRPFVAGADGRGGDRARLPGARRHRPRRGDAVRRRPRARSWSSGRGYGRCRRRSATS